ncbi:MAG TPA: hemerythrin domain-containing protein [Rhizomicrobium sp.]|jgi:hypothetical protein|nr:hemerythrin domain-containing protein [Rhizomicrobium sp.]
MPPRKKPDAIALLKSDHRKVDGLFRKFDRARDSRTKKSLADEICTELSIHAMIEEEIFYPAGNGEVDDDLRLESYVEHDGAKVLIAELSQSGPENEFYDAKMTALAEQIRHHIREEEKPGKGLFAQARKAGLDMEELGARLMARKQQLQSKIKSEGLPPPTTRSFTGHKLIAGAPVGEDA